MIITRIATFLIVLVCSASAQSGRVSPGADTSGTPAATAEVSVKQLFDEANSYLRVKAADFEERKVTFSDRLLDQTRREQRQLAAKYAASAATRVTIAGDDLYYLGMLYWICENLNAASENLSKFIADDTRPADRVQAARSVVAVAAARQKHLDLAESTLDAYLRTEPARASEVYRMELELAKAYQLSREFVKMAPHAQNAFITAKAALKGAASRPRAINEILDAGLLVFDAYSGAGDRMKADASLDELRSTGVELVSPSFWYYAVDKKITYLIDTGRKREAIQLYIQALADSKKEMLTPTARSDAFARLQRRELHYKLLGETALEFPEFDRWLPGSPRTLASMRGKVVLLDFWAMWCGPCIAAFPSIRDWQSEFGKDGFEVLGITRYYGDEVGARNPTHEIELLTAFRSKYSLPYDFVIAKGQILQNLYGAVALPTAVLIDRKGIIRYIETGTGATRLDEMRVMITKLMAEREK